MLQHGLFPFSYAKLFGRQLPLVLLLIGALAGCTTRKQVEQIVTQSNAAILAAQLGGAADTLKSEFDGLPDPDGRAKAGLKPWEQAAAKIEAFIAAHPDQKITIAQLRIRQAMMFLSYEQFNLAEAAFNAAMDSDLHTDRDKALKRAHKHLLWWFKKSAEAEWDNDDQTNSKAALEQLKTEQTQLAASLDIRDYFAELRVWIGLRSALAVTGGTRDKELFEDALNTYAKIFTSDDLAALKSGLENPAASNVGEMRRRLRAKAILDYAKEVKTKQQIAPTLETAVFQEWIHRR